MFGYEIEKYIGADEILDVGAIGSFEFDVYESLLCGLFRMIQKGPYLFNMGSLERSSNSQAF